MHVVLIKNLCDFNVLLAQKRISEFVEMTVGLNGQNVKKDN